MWQRKQLIAGLLRRAPRWTAVLLCGLIVADLAHSAWVLRPAKTGSAEPRLLQPPRVSPLNIQRVTAAHLFGTTDRPDANPGSAPETQLALALSGVIATKDPGDGYAILGEQGKPAHLYRVGAPLAASRGRLFQVFADRVVLDFDGRLETLRLPRSPLPGLLNRPIIVAAAEAGVEAATTAPVEVDPRQTTPVQSVFGSIDAVPTNVDGRMIGMIMHPERRLQRQYGLRDGDMLTAVNGVEINDPDALQNVIRSSSGKSLSLTFVRDGVQQTKALPVGD